MICQQCGKSCQQTGNHQLYCDECRHERHKECARRYYAEHREECGEYMRRYYAEHREEILEKNKRYRWRKDAPK